MCWLCRAVDHVFDSLDPYLDSRTSFKRYTYKKKLHGNSGVSKGRKIKAKKVGKQKHEHSGRYRQNKNKQVVVQSASNVNDSRNTKVNIRRERNIVDHIYHRNNLKRTRSMPIYTGRHPVEHRRTLAIEGPKPNRLSRSARDLRSRSSNRSSVRQGRRLQRSHSEGADIRNRSNRKNVHIHRSRSAQRRSPTRRALSARRSRSVSRRRHSYDEEIHKRNQRNLRSRPPSVKSTRKRALRHRQALENDGHNRHNVKHHMIHHEAHRPVSHQGSLKSSLKHNSNSHHVSRNDDILHRDRKLNVKGAEALRYDFSQSSESEEEEEEEEEEEYSEEEYEERRTWQIKESLRIRREEREEYFEMMEELFAMSGDGIHSKAIQHLHTSISCMTFLVCNQINPELGSEVMAQPQSDPEKLKNKGVFGAGRGGDSFQFCKISTR